MSTLTTNFNFQKPAVNSADDEDLWGDQLNDNLDALDGYLKIALGATVQASQVANFTAVSTIKTRNFYPCDASGGAITAALPTAASAGAGAIVIFKKTDNSTNAVTIDADGTEEIDGATTYALTTENATLVLICDGTGWQVFSTMQAFVGAGVANGRAGLVPAPTIADAAAGKVLGADGTWRDGIPVGGLIRSVTKSVVASTAYTGSHTVPDGDTAPTTANTEEFMTATDAIGADSTDDFIRFTGQVCFDGTPSGSTVIFGIFRDAEPDAIATFPYRDPANNHIDARAFYFRMQADDTDDHTYTMRAGTDTGGGFYINGDSTGRFYGGTLLTELNVEILKGA